MLFSNPLDKDFFLLDVAVSRFSLREGKKTSQRFFPTAVYMNMYRPSTSTKGPIINLLKPACMDDALLLIVCVYYQGQQRPSREKQLKPPNCLHVTHKHIHQSSQRRDRGGVNTAICSYMYSTY